MSLRFSVFTAQISLHQQDLTPAYDTTYQKRLDPHIPVNCLRRKKKTKHFYTFPHVCFHADTDTHKRFVSHKLSFLWAGQKPLHKQLLYSRGCPLRNLQTGNKLIFMQLAKKNNLDGRRNAEKCSASKAEQTFVCDSDVGVFLLSTLPGVASIRRHQISTVLFQFLSLQQRPLPCLSSGDEHK